MGRPRPGRAAWLADPRRALVLFSGGQDSTVCLAYALERYAHVETIGFDYGQRHLVELREPAARARAAAREVPALGARGSARTTSLDLSLLAQLSDTALTSEREIEMNAGGLPNTFVPGRNLLFFTVRRERRRPARPERCSSAACARPTISGYPDCRDNTLKSLQVAISLGLDKSMTIETPLMWLDKAATWAMTEELGGEPLIELVIEHTHSCYLGDREHRHAWG